MAKPSSLLSCICLSSAELWIVLTRCSFTVDAASSSFTKDIRELVTPITDLIYRYDADDWQRNGRGFLFRQTDKLYERFAEAEDTMIETEFQKLPGCRELTGLHWIVNAARNVLRHMYSSSKDLPNNITVLNELTSLRESLLARKHLIDCCVKDMASLKLCEDLSSVYHSQISLLIDMLKCGSDGHRTEDECIFALSKLCHRQVDIEARLTGRAHPAAKEASYASPTSPGKILKDSPLHKSRQKSASNPLWLVMQNVFPSDHLS